MTREQKFNLAMAVCCALMGGLVGSVVFFILPGNKPKPIQVPTRADVAAVEGAAAEARPAAELEVLVTRLRSELASFQIRNAELEKDLAGYRQANNPVAKEIGLWLNRHAAQHDQERQALRSWINEVQAGLRNVAAQQDAKKAAALLEIIKRSIED